MTFVIYYLFFSLG